MNHINRDYMTVLKEYAAITAGTLLVAAAVVYYLIPCRLVTGSVSGLALVLDEIVPLGEDTLVLILNVLCLLAGMKAFGRRFGIRSVYVSLLLPLCMKILPAIVQPVKMYSLPLAVVCFLLVLTAGQTILFESGTASGGIDTIAEILARRTGIRTGTAIAAAGILTCLTAALVYDFKAVLIGIVVTALNGILLNLAVHLKTWLRAFRNSGLEEVPVLK